MAAPRSLALPGNAALNPDGGFWYRGDGALMLGGRVISGGVPAAFTSRAITDADDNSSLLCATAQVATVDKGLPSGFGCAFKGTVTFAGTATVTDVRTTGATNPWCALTQTGNDTYDVVGTKV